VTCSVRHDLSICQGKTFEHPIMWGVHPMVYKPIESIERSAPTRVKCVGHGLVEDWPVAVSHVVGMREINARQEPPDAEDFYSAHIVDVDHVEIPPSISLLYSAYTSGGVLRYASMPDFSGLQGRMHIRNKVGGILLMDPLTTEDDQIVLDNLTKKLTIHLSAAVTEALQWVLGVYDLELYNASGVVHSVIHGKVKVTREVTTSV